MQSLERMKVFEESLDQYFSYLRCYPPQQIQRIKNDICQTLYQNPLLVPGYAPLRSISGVSKQLVIYIHGAIRISYFSKDYDVPIHVYIPTNYPSAPPFCFVIPNQQILLKPRHKHCDTNGVIYHPLLSNWKPNFTILSLLMELKKEFSNDPPVMQTTIVQGPPLPPREPSRPPISNITAQSDLPPYIRPQAKSPQIERESIDSLRKKLHAKIMEKMSLLQEETNKEREKEQQYRSLDDSELRMAQDTERMILESKILEEDIRKLSTWLHEHENADPTEIEQSPLQKQYFEAKAADESYSDILYHCASFQRRGFRDNMDLDLYLKTIRKIAREQFLERALWLKIEQHGIEKTFIH